MKTRDIVIIFVAFILVSLVTGYQAGLFTGERLDEIDINNVFLEDGCFYLKLDDGSSKLLNCQPEDNEFNELQWDWYGSTSFILGEPISFSVSRMNVFCDEVFTAKIVNLDRSQIFWQDSSKVECSDIKGGKISRVDFPVEVPIEIDTAGTYYVVVDYAEFHGLAMFTKRINIEEPSTTVTSLTEDEKCREGSRFVDGVCIVDNPLNCDPDDPYDHGCGVADVDVNMTGGFGITIAILSIVIPASIITISFIVWRKRK